MLSQTQLQHGQPFSKALLMGLRHLRGFQVSAVQRIVFRLAAGQRTHAQNRIQKRFGNIPVALRHDSLHHLGHIRFQKIQLFGLRRRQLIGHTRQDLPHRAHLRIDAFDRVDDLSVLIHQHDVGVASHDLHRQSQLHQIAHLVDRLEHQMQDAVHPHLLDADKARRAQMFSQQHTEHRRLLGILRRGLGKVDAGAAGVCRQQQFSRAAPPAKGNDDLFSRGLMDAVHSRIQRQLRDLVPQLIQKHSVQSHRSSLLFSGQDPLDLVR